MRIVIGGRAGSGKSTIAKLVAKKLGLKHYSMGDLQREIAREKGISLLELGRLEEKDGSIDKELDSKQKEIGIREDNFVIDGRLSAFFIPNSVKIFLDADEETRAKRVLKDERVEENNIDLKKTIENTRAREYSESRRYRKYYGCGCYDESIYDHIVDTADLSVKEAVDEVLDIINKQNQNFK